MGYSLGGTLANLLSHRTGLPSNAIAPIGSKHIAQLNKIGIPTNEELEFSNSGTIYVRPYVRTDGTQVKGYYRAR